MNTEEEAKELISTLKKRFKFTRLWVCDQLGFKHSRLNDLFKQLTKDGYIKRLNKGERPFIYQRAKDIELAPVYTYKDNMNKLCEHAWRFWTPTPMRADIDYYGSHAGQYGYKLEVSEL